VLELSVAVGVVCPFLGLPGRRSVKMEPGDLMLLYTDEIIEAPDGRGREYGTDRVKRALWKLRRQPAREIVEEILGSVHDWTGDRPQEDDQTVVAVRRRTGKTGSAGSAPKPLERKAI
jgi:phosphoserine phosphatase RsbU/P